MGFLDGTTPKPPKNLEADQDDGKKVMIHNPEYSSWMKNDQQVLSYLLNSLSPEALAPVASAITAAEAWGVLEKMFAAQSKARVANLRVLLSTTKKGNMSSAAYFTKMCSYKDELAAVGKVVDDDEMIHFVLNGLDFDYNPFVTSMLGRDLSLSELYSQLLIFDQRMEMFQENGQFQSSANMVGRGRGSRRNSRGRGRDNNRGRGRSNPGRGGGRGAPNSGRGNAPKQGQSNDDPICQICKKGGHLANRCWYRYEEDSNYQKIVGAANTAYGYDTNWYVDSGASEHVTGALEKMTMHDQYQGQDKIHTASGAGMKISNIGHAILHTPDKDLHLNKVLHVPSIKKDLLSVHKLTRDNDIFVEFHPNFFLIKDRETKRIL